MFVQYIPNYKKFALSYFFVYWVVNSYFIKIFHKKSGAMKKIVKFCEVIACQSSVSCLFACACVYVCVSACENGALEHPES